MTFRSGFIVLIGRPNVGKSSLLNKILGQKISIVTSRVQTTRNKILGVHTEKNGQIVFIDLPGTHKPLDKMGEKCWKTSREGYQDGDIGVLIFEANSKIGKDDTWILDWLKKNEKKRPQKLIVLLNKTDLLDEFENKHKKIEEKISQVKERLSDIKEIIGILCISAVTGEGVEEFLKLCIKNLPEGERFYPDDFLTDQPLRFIASELIREELLNSLSDEIPHSVAVSIESFSEQEMPKPLVKIHAKIFVERDSQKGIIIGKGGSKIKEISTNSRLQIERLVEKPVFLDLKVKVLEKWRKDENKLKSLGYE